MVQVAIVGSGFAGPVLALCLKKHGVTSTIFEIRPKDYSHGGNIALAPNALRVLDHVGVYDIIRNQGFNYEELCFTSGQGHLLGKFLNGSIKNYHFPALRIHRETVKQALRKRVEDEGIPVYYGKKASRIIEETDSSATLEFADGERVTADFVIGADGIHSRIRSFFNDCKPTFSGLMGVMGTVDASKLQDVDHGLQLPCMMFGDTGSFAIMPSSFDGKEVGYFATIEQQDRGREGWKKLEENTSELKTMLTERYLFEKDNHWPELVKALTERTPTETLSSWPFFSVPHMDKFSSPKGHVIVIGDSAHAIPPTGGQGAAMALEDAESLGYTISHACWPDFDKTHLPELITAWEGHRLPRLAKVVDFTTKNGSLRKSSPHYIEQAAKEWVIWAAFKTRGEEGGAQWMYSYNAEDVLKDLQEIGLNKVSPWD